MKYRKNLEKQTRDYLTLNSEDTRRQMSAKIINCKGAT